MDTSEKDFETIIECFLTGIEASDRVREEYSSYEAKAPDNLRIGIQLTFFSPKSKI